MVLLSVEKKFFRGAEGYELARRATVWNGLLPDRFPDVIVQAHDTDDVVAAIRYARANGHKVGVRSGGHSWAASHLRDGGLLLDVSRLDHCTVDPDRMTADAGPGKIAAVVQHEMGHAATLQGARYNGHDSFVEGIAEYCAYTGHPSSWASYRIDDVRDYIRTGKWSKQVYLTDEITSKDGLTASAAYGIGYLALRHLVEKYGLAKMLAFWGSIEQTGHTPEVAAQATFHVSWATLNADCVAYIHHITGA